MGWEVIVLVINFSLLIKLFLYLGDIIEHALRFSCLLQLVVLRLGQVRMLRDK